jgi:hypothetical protein
MFTSEIERKKEILFLSDLLHRMFSEIRTAQKDRDDAVIQELASSLTEAEELAKKLFSTNTILMQILHDPYLYVQLEDSRTAIQNIIRMKMRISKLIDLLYLEFANAESYFGISRHAIEGELEPKRIPPLQGGSYDQQYISGLSDVISSLFPIRKPPPPLGGSYGQQQQPPPPLGGSYGQQQQPPPPLGGSYGQQQQPPPPLGGSYGQQQQQQPPPTPEQWISSLLSSQRQSKREQEQSKSSEDKIKKEAIKARMENLKKAIDERIVK